MSKLLTCIECLTPCVKIPHERDEFVSLECRTNHILLIVSGCCMKEIPLGIDLN